MSRTCEAVLLSYISDVVIEPINSYVHLYVYVYVYVYLHEHVLLQIGHELLHNGAIVEGALPAWPGLTCLT